MDITISPRLLGGELNIIPSKSQAHRYLICAAFADRPTELICPEVNEDIEATADCLRALGAQVERTVDGYRIAPISDIPQKAVLHCRESGSTLRFLLPVAGALGVETTFVMDGRLPQRPLSPLWEEMERMGCQLTRPSENTIACTGKLRPGHFSIDGSVSSQYITGLLFALSIMDSPNKLTVTGKIESKPYIEITKAAMKAFGVDPDHSENQTYRSPGTITVEADWSNGAFWVAARQLGNPIQVEGLNPHSPQGDRVAEWYLQTIANAPEAPVIQVSDIPDLVPIMAVVAAAGKGLVMHDIRRLRLKESDRVASTLSMIENLGGKAKADENTMQIYGTGLKGGTVDACNDHRIAMAAAIAATVCTEPVTILGAECVKKSYPGFWDAYKTLGGVYEQHLR